MAREFAASFYKSKTWQHCRDEYAKSVGHLCEDCLARGLLVPGVIVHHKIHLTPETIKDPAIALSFDNLKLVCRDCHAREHRPERRYSLDDLGRVTV